MGEGVYIKANRMKEIMLIRAVSREGNNEEYQELRREVMQYPPIKILIPECVRTCRNLQEFWYFISPKFPHWAERRAYIAEQFAPMLNLLEADASLAVGTSVDGALAAVNWENVQGHWAKVQERMSTDPTGAITRARTLVESVCKHILDETGTPYTDKEDLPTLYGKTVKQLQLHPSQQTSGTMKQIMGGCWTVIEGLSSLRNQQGDAHGKGITHVIEPRLAELAVNAAGTLASFLIRELASQRYKS